MGLPHPQALASAREEEFERWKGHLEELEVALHAAQQESLTYRRDYSLRAWHGILNIFVRQQHCCYMLLLVHRLPAAAAALFLRNVTVLSACLNIRVLACAIYEISSLLVLTADLST